MPNATCGTRSHKPHHLGDAELRSDARHIPHLGRWVGVFNLARADHDDLRLSAANELLAPR